MLKILINRFDGHCITDDPAPLLSFRKDGGSSLSAMAITVSDASGEIFWESGKIAWTPSLRYRGKKLEPKSVYTVSAKLFGEAGNQADSETETVFETGFLGEQWSAGWIEPEQEPAVHESEVKFFELFAHNPDFFGGQVRLRPCREIKKTIVLDAPPERARIYASAHGIYRLTVNGTAASGELFAPGSTAYNEVLYYQTYDVGCLLQQGENEILVTLADGWWIGRIGISGDSCQYGDRLGCIIEADISLADGTVLKVCSDDTFQSRRSRIDYADLFIGQRSDFNRPDDPWSPCKNTGGGSANLTAQPITPVEIYSSLKPLWSVSPKGELIADFGQCIAGVVDITVTSEQGTEVTLDFCEVLDNEGNFLRNILGRNKDQRDVFVCGKGPTTFAPRFTYHGFRYVRIDGVSQEDITGLTARAMGTEIAERGYFSCSDERLNRLQANIRNSARSNMFSVPTDCPQREKAGWTGDAAAFAPTGCFNYYLDGFLSGWLANMRVEQFSTGEVPVVVPNYPAQEQMQKAMGGSSSSAWSDACVLVPWAVYRSYGDIEILKENLDMMRRWLVFTESVCRRSPEKPEDRTDKEMFWNDYLFNKGYHFGDWFIPSFVRRDGGVMEATAATKDVVGSCFHAIVLDVYVKVLTAVAGESGGDEILENEIALMSGRLEKVRQAVRDCYIEETGTVRGDLQGLYVIVLLADAAQGELRKKVFSRLCELIEENEDRLDTGFVSTPHLLDILTDNGRADLALSLLFQTESPSWLYMVEKGATTIWENWEAIRPDGTAMPSSFNHYALGSVGNYLYRRIGGLEATAPGYSSIRFAPEISCGLTYAESRVETCYGTVSCRWELNNGKCMIELEVPSGCDAVLSVAGKELSVQSGQSKFEI